jgi:hypothetical protein
MRKFMSKRTLLAALAVLLSVRAMAAAEPIANVLPCGTVGSVGGLGAGTDLTRYPLNTARFPNAVCNDGTPGVFYYAPATRVEDQGKWMIFLQGGGGCTSGQDCAQRWCSIDTNYGMDKMTSSLTKPSIRGAGFMAPDSRNRFRTWNRVLIFYCSSDQWGGAKASTVTATAPDGAAVEYSIQFRGSNIVDAVLDTLRNATAPGRRRAVRHSFDSAPEATSSPWPDLDDATDVIFAGSSGGGGGVKNNGDRAGIRLRAANPGLDYRILIDAATNPDTSQMSYAGTTYCAADPAGCTFESFTRGRYEAIDVALYGNRGDDSCMAYHAGREPGSEWICSDKMHVALHHLTSPFFLHQDLIDPQVSDGFVESGLGTLGDFAVRVDSMLRSLPAPEEPRGGTPGLFTLQCGTHEAFTSTEVFTIDVNGANYNEIVWNWWRGEQPQQNLVTYSGTATPQPSCPPPD